MMARMMVMRSRFYSTRPVPVWEAYMDEAIMSEMPVPLPLCSRMNTIRPAPEMNSSTIRKMVKKPNVNSLFVNKPKLVNVHYSAGSRE